MPPRQEWPLPKQPWLTEAGVATATAGFKYRARIQSAEAGVAAAEKEIERLIIKRPLRELRSDTAEIGSLLQPAPCVALSYNLINQTSWVPT